MNNRFNFSLCLVLILLLGFAPLGQLHAALSGNYSINASLAASATNYLNPASAVSDLLSGSRADGGPVNGPGVSGPVLFTASGTFNSLSLSLSAISGASAANTITFRGGTWTGTTNVISVNGASYIRFTNLMLNTTTQSTSNGLVITNCSQIQVDSCSISGSIYDVQFGGGMGSALRVTNSSQVLIDKNYVSGGQASIWVAGTGTQTAVVVTRNTAHLYTYEALRAESLYDFTMTGNAFSPTFGVTPYLPSGCVVLNNVDRFVVERNSLTGGTDYALQIINGNYQSGSPASRARLVNNMISFGTGVTTPTPFDASAVNLSGNCRDIDIWHNSVQSVVAAVGTDKGAALYVTSTCTGLNVRNCSFSNIFPTIGRALYIQSLASLQALNFNNYYTANSNYFVYLGADYAPATYAGVGGFNLNSRVGNPGYVSAANLHCLAGSTQLFDGGTNLGIANDFDLDTRPLPPTLIPDIGADEYVATLPIVDAGISAIPSPAATVAPGVYSVTAMIYNYGTTLLTSATVNWRVNGVLQTPYNWTGAVAPGNSSGPIIIGNRNFPLGRDTVRAWTTSPNGMSDANVANDSLLKYVCAVQWVNLGPNVNGCTGDTLSLTTGVTGTAYLWNNGATTPALDVTLSGNWHVTVTQLDGCTDRDTVTINLFPLPTFSLGPDPTYCPPSHTISGPAGMPQYHWSNGASTMTTTVNSTGPYSLTVTSAMSCSFADTLNVTFAPLPAFSLGNDTMVCGGPLTINGPAGMSLYHWMNNSNASSLTVSSSVMVTLDVQNATGCTASDTIHVTIGQPTPISLGNDTAVCDTFVSLQGPAGMNAYQWSTGDTTAGLQALISGSYALTVTNASGCLSSDTINLTVQDTCVWPGDANADFTANNLDVLSIGIAYGMSGTARAAATINWLGQFCPDWASHSQPGINDRHTDCNGDGLTSFADTAAVSANYGMVHLKTNLTGGGGLPLFFSGIPDSLPAGDTLHGFIELGTTVSPAVDVYGLAFTLHYDGYLTSAQGPQLDYTSSLLGTSGNDLLPYVYRGLGPGRTEHALVRTDHVSLSGGSGPILAFSLATVDTFTQPGAVPLLLLLDGLKVVDANGIEIPANASSQSVILYRTATGMDAGNGQSFQASLFPNPTSGRVEVAATGLRPGEAAWRLLDPLGHALRSGTEKVQGKSGRWSLDFSDLPGGVYFLQIENQHHQRGMRLVLQH